MMDIFDMDRRGLLQRLLLLAGTTAVAGIGGPGLLHAAEGPAFFSTDDFALVSAVADTIIPRTDTPGAIDARVPAAFDALLAGWASPQRRDQLLQALRAIDARARQEAGPGFAQLSPDRRKRLLTVHDAEALAIARVPPPAPQGTVAPLPAPGPMDPAYADLKELIVILYYLSEPALTHELTYVHAPGEWQPSIPVTPRTRPYGAGMF